MMTGKSLRDILRAVSRRWDWVGFLVIMLLKSYRGLARNGKAVPTAPDACSSQTEACIRYNSALGFRLNFWNHRRMRPCPGWLMMVSLVLGKS